MFVLLSIAMSWLCAQAFKALMIIIREKKITREKLLKSGGMPSSHTAVVISASVCIGCEHGFLSNVFAVCLVFALVVMFDAMNVRRVTGILSQTFNQTLDDIYPDDKEKAEKKMVPEIEGHTLSEVVAGTALGAAVGMVVGIIEYGAPVLFR